MFGVLHCLHISLKCIRTYTGLWQLKTHSCFAEDHKWQCCWDHILCGVMPEMKQFHACKADILLLSFPQLPQSKSWCFQSINYSVGKFVIYAGKPRRRALKPALLIYFFTCYLKESIKSSRWIFTCYLEKVLSLNQYDILLCTYWKSFYCCY